MIISTTNDVFNNLSNNVNNNNGISDISGNGISSRLVYNNSSISGSIAIIIYVQCLSFLLLSTTMTPFSLLVINCC